MIKFKLHIILLLMSLGAVGQDMHFSQYLNVPLYLNPALTGQDVYRLRGGVAYRNQWSSFTIPYTTQTAFLDVKLTHKKLNQDYIGIGGAVYNDIAGHGELQTSMGHLLASYTKSFNRMQTTVGGIGISSGFGNQSLNVSDLIFDNQWTGSGFDPYQSSYEHFHNQSYFYWDLNAGLFYKTIHQDKLEFHSGISFNHVNKPYQKFYGSKERMAMKTIGHAGLTIRITKGLYLKPDVMITYVNQAKEILYGGLAVYKTEHIYIYAGAWVRSKFDIIPTAGFFIYGFRIMASYDLNISKLNYATNMKGGFEITISKSLGFIGNYMSPMFKQSSSVPKFSAY